MKPKPGKLYEVIRPLSLYLEETLSNCDPFYGEFEIIPKAILMFVETRKITVGDDETMLVDFYLFEDKVYSACNGLINNPKKYVKEISYLKPKYSKKGRAKNAT